jgi:hypothetical protein
MLPAIAAGIGVLIAGHVLGPFVNPSGRWTDLVVPVLAGFASSWLAPRRRVVVGVSMAVPPALVFGVAQTACELTDGRCDHVGLAGTAFLTAFTFAWGLALCGVGAAAAAVVRSRLRARLAREPPGTTERQGRPGS